MNPTPIVRRGAPARARFATLGALAVSVSMAQIASAATGTWSNAAGGLWSADGNWASGGIADGSGFVANFNASDITGNITVTLDSARTIGGLVFADTDTASAGSWILGNNNNAANVLTLAGSAPTITVNALNSSSLVTISAILEGADGLTKAGAGILSLSAANTYAGGTTISAGSLRALNGSALGSGAVTVGSGARLQLGAGVTIANTINLNGSSALYGNTGANALSGTVNLQSASTVSLNATNDNNLTFGGNLALGGNTLTVTTVGNTNAFVAITGTVTGTGGITKTGAGLISMLADQSATYSGTTTLSLGTLAIGHNGALGTGTFTFGANDNPVSIRGSDGTARTLANAITLAGNAGANAVFNFGSSNSAVNGDLTFSNTGNIAMGSVNRKFSVYNTTQFNGAFTGSAALTLQTGAGTLVLNGANTYTGATAISAGTLQLGNGGVTGSLAVASAIINNSNFAIRRGNATVQGVDFASAISGTGSFTQSGSGTTTLVAGNTYTGNTVISAGTLAMGANNAFGATNFAMSGGTFAVGSFNDSAGTLALGGNASISLGSGGFFAFAGSNALNWGSNTLSITGSFVDGFSIRFGTDGTGLTSAQLALISINGAAATINSSGYLVSSAIPEPSTCALLAGGALLGFALVRRRGPRAV